METFYRFLGGPRTFWGGSNRTIINNNFIGAMPMMRPMCRPMPMMPMIGNHCCGGSSNGLNWMLGFGLASSLAGGIMNLFGNNQSNNNSYVMNNQSYIPGNNYNNYNNYNSSSNQYSNQYIADLSAKVNQLEDDLADCQKQIDDLSKSKCNCKNKEITVVSTPSDQEIAATEAKKQETTQTATQTQTPEAPEEKTEEVKDETSEDETPKTLDDALKNAGFNDLDKTAQDYVKNKISQAYIDENGNIKYDITAVVHDGDSLNSIINRFYTESEKNNLEVQKAKLHTQGSETSLIVNPLSGDTVVARGVSEYGLKALMQDAKNGITKQGEITKTNKRISDLKTSFINGDKKLSKAYVLQNKLMTEDEYNKIINEKYSQ